MISENLSKQIQCHKMNEKHWKEKYSQYVCLIFSEFYCCNWVLTSFLLCTRKTLKEIKKYIRDWLCLLKQPTIWVQFIKWPTGLTLPTWQRCLPFQCREGQAVGGGWRAGHSPPACGKSLFRHQPRRGSLSSLRLRCLTYGRERTPPTSGLLQGLMS